jgi:hypothetical protein
MHLRLLTENVVLSDQRLPQSHQTNPPAGMVFGQARHSDRGGFADAGNSDWVHMAAFRPRSWPWMLKGQAYL